MPTFYVILLLGGCTMSFVRQACAGANNAIILS